ncbi:MAG: hypothetical protein GY733_00835 [bacterium]|nr:hypothetical protein [bacterium]
MRWLFASLSTALLLAGTVLADTANVVAASAECEESICTFRVTVQHPDQGWKHYANGWDVLAADGVVIATRVLRHPHVKEQPFTRELRGVVIPSGITSVRIRARDSVHGYGGREVVVELNR